MKHIGLVSAGALMAAMAASGAWAQTARTQWAPPAPPIEAPRDTPYAAGTLRLTVDATDLDHRIFKMHEVVPVDHSGDVVLMLPKWLPGHHSPGTDISKIANVTFTIDGEIVPWTRDVVDINAFHIAVPKGARDITADFDFLSATTDAAGKTLMTQDMLDLEWNFASLYPAGYYAKRIPIQASVTFPKGWGFGTALEAADRSGDTVTFKPVDYDTLIDSPIYAGRYFKQLDLDPGAAVSVHMDIVADKPDLLDIPDDVVAIHRKLIQQAYKLYGSHHYDHYDFLVSASSQLVSNGLEHHRSSEDGVTPKYFTDWKTKYVGRDLFAHEYTHSWDGKFRRPWDLWTPNFQVPMRDSLLWVYEGQTQYWGNVLATRSGLYSKDQMLQYLA
ncbi:MAG: M61 family metallopeptidase, partial [Asticcacaulis sp.]